jgi:hypothetical protein
MNLGKWKLGRPKTWDDNINMDFSAAGFEDGRWMELVQDRAQWCICVLAALNHRVLLGVHHL